MSRRTLTIIDTTSEMREINLDRIGKRELLLGACGSDHIQSSGKVFNEKRFCCI